MLPGVFNKSIVSTLGTRLKGTMDPRLVHPASSRIPYFTHQPDPKLVKTYILVLTNTSAALALSHVGDSSHTFPHGAS